MDGTYRHELKYQITPADYWTLRPRLRAVLHPDPHAGEDGTYRIQSIYFDNYQDKALREKAGGTAKREKWRIRWYNNDLSFFMLEKKMKVDSLCMKFDAALTGGECRRILRNDTDWMLSRGDLLREFCCRQRAQQLRPRVIVSYLREPYLYGPGNVRVTFDSDIRTSLYEQDFLGAERVDIPAMDGPGSLLLEVKYDHYLPAVVQDLIQIGRARQGAFSKYVASRRFG